MNTLGAQILTGLQVLALPLNLAALLAGTLAGALLGAMFRHIGVSGAAVLVLLMPVAVTLDPTTSVVLLGSCLTAALIATRQRDPATAEAPRHHNVPLMALLAGLVVILASASAAALLQTAAPADTVALLVCAAAAAIILAAVTHPAGWPAAIILTLAGILLQFNPLPPLDTKSTSPLPLLFGLLVIGPAVMALAQPRRIAPWSTAFGGVELAATILPAFLIGVPATRGMSVLALNLGESGLALGPRLMTQRPRLVLGFVLALLVAGLLGMAGRLISDRLARASWWPDLAATNRTRAAAAIILLLSVAALYVPALNMDTAALRPLLLTLLATAAIGALAAWFGLELAPLVTGLVIGQLMQAPLTSALIKANGDMLAALTSGSPALLALALVAILATLAWPLLARRINP